MRDIGPRGVATGDELRMANDLMAGLFEPSAPSDVEWLYRRGASYPGFRREHTRVVLSDGLVVGALRILSDTVRIGEARLKMGGLGWVSTDSAFRHRGIGRRLIESTMQYMRGQRFHVAMLFGIPNFYHRFGFTTSLVEYATTVLITEGLAAEPGPYKLREGKPGDIPAIQRMHNRDDGETACSIVRSAAHIKNFWYRWEGLRVLMDAKGKVVAYFVPRAREEEMHVIEAGAASYGLCPPLLHACAALASEWHASRMRFAAPPAHPFARYLLRYRSTHEMRVTRDQGGMMAFVDLPEALESMIPEWESRVQRGRLREVRTEITLLVDAKPYRVRAYRGAVDITPVAGKNKIGLSQAELMHLVTGYRYADEVYAHSRRMVTQEGKALFTALFPKRHPYVWENDRF